MAGGEVHRATLEYIGHGAGFCAVTVAEESNSSTEQALRQPRDKPPNPKAWTLA